LGQTPDLAELTAVDQRLDLWTGTVHSTFTLAGADLWVTTVVHPTRDTWAVRVRSTAPVQLTLRFPYGSEAWGNAADWDHPERHTSILRHDDDRWAVDRVLDGDLAGGHRVALTLDGELSVEQVGPHAVRIDAGREVDVALTHLRATATDPGETSFATCLAAATEHWPRFWTTGGAVELLAADPRAAEIERRTVLSTYLTAVNCAGSLPPQETGLMVNSWRGRFHLEMHWWHAAHFPVWGRPELLDASLSWYAKAQPLAEQTAGDQGLAGARWPKQVGPDGRESPSDIGPFLIWQQPHPIHLAELCYRASADESEQLATLHRWEEVVTSTAEFMASFASRGPDGYGLGPPVIPAQESYGAIRAEVHDPTFELAYWQWALRTALAWQARLGRSQSAHWREVAERLVTPTVVDGRYAAHAHRRGTAEPYTGRTDHPSMVCALGVVPTTDLIDPAVMSATLDDVLADWDWPSTWGWDYPALAMCATRLGRPDLAVDALLMGRGKNTHLVNGHNRQTDALPVYLPGNGGLLIAVALMAAGWDGSEPAPGFPADWTVRCEGVHPLPG